MTSSTTALVTPRRPWVNRRDVFKDLVPAVLIAAALAALIVNFTGLAGPLGCYVAFVVAYLVVSFLFGRRHDKVKAVDKVMQDWVEKNAGIYRSIGVRIRWSTLKGADQYERLIYRGRPRGK